MVTVQVIEEGPRNLVVLVVGSGAPDVAATIVDVSALNPSCTRVRLMKVIYDCAPGESVDLLWDATSDVTFLRLNEGNGQTMCFFKTGGIPNNAGAGVTGDVLLTSAVGDYTAHLHFAKGGTIDSLVD